MDEKKHKLINSGKIQWWLLGLGNHDADPRCFRLIRHFIPNLWWCLLCAMAPGSSEESLGSRLDLTSLAQEWDSDPELRGRWRDGGSFLHPDTPAGEDIKGCCLNRMLLVPLLTRMAVSEKRVLPSIHDLHAAVESALTLNKRPPKPEDYEGLMAVAWRVRFMAGFVKMKVRRSEVSQVSCFEKTTLCTHIMFHVKTIPVRISLTEWKGSAPL